jgi:hypothetical protein
MPKELKTQHVGVRYVDSANAFVGEVGLCAEQQHFAGHYETTLPKIPRRGRIANASQGKR